MRFKVGREGSRKGASQKTRLTDFAEVGLLHVQSILDDRYTGVGDDAVNGTESLVNLLEGRLDLLGVADVTLPCLDLDVVLLGEVGSDVVCVLGAVENDGDVGGSLGEGLGDSKPDTCKDISWPDICLKLGALTSVTASDDDGRAREVDWPRQQLIDETLKGYSQETGILICVCCRGTIDRSLSSKKNGMYEREAR